MLDDLVVLLIQVTIRFVDEWSCYISSPESTLGHTTEIGLGEFSFLSVKNLLRIFQVK